MSETKWTRQDLIKFCLDLVTEIEGGYDLSYKLWLRSLNEEQLHKEADWLYGLSLK